MREQLRPKPWCRARYLEHEFAAAMISEDRQVRLMLPCAKTISDIVKRECGRQARESVCPAVMFGKHTVVGLETDLPLVFL
ncbi:hypothetical protein PQI07_19530 [Methylobacterium sp. 092160098-2]|uniref:hypothetical protein n=1 Tax=Methylobacterium sp. 092160098-2 TaxID=3025129 RepID=UPI002381B805|nr:hypothetical protein [Methylobacterium sp. 092160098-2]MDE4911950.1 hypothetical protein [Methylobacterium sp. 092160098-2]MDE4912873.1 hypothetical protein [Methylobacterium sp. 092160098-2]